MTLHILRGDALRTEDTGCSIRVSLPWIRSLPLACLREVTVRIDGHVLGDIRLRLGDRLIEPEDVRTETAWWYVQDRVVLESGHRPAPGAHRVTVDFRLLVPYLPGGPDSPLILPFHDEQDCIAGAELGRSDVSLDAA